MKLLFPGRCYSSSRFLNNVEFKETNSDKYTRTKVIGEGGKPVIRAMRWPAEYELMPHEHHGRPCMELIVSGNMEVKDIKAKATQCNKYILEELR